MEVEDPVNTIDAHVENTIKARKFEFGFSVGVRFCVRVRVIWIDSSVFCGSHRGWLVAKTLQQ